MTEGPPPMNRRKFLENAASLATGIAIGGAAKHLLDRNDGEPASESKETLSLNQWEAALSGYTKLYESLERNEILFVDDYGAPLTVLKIENIDGISPWKENASLDEGSLSQEWLNLVRNKICAQKTLQTTCDIAQELPKMMTMLGPMREVYSIGVGDLKDTMELRAQNPRHYVDIVKYFGNKEVVGASGTSRIDYLREYVMQDSPLPKIIQQKLPGLLVGLAAQESKFNNASLSSIGARGIFQFMPDTWEEVAKDKDPLSYRDQVAAVLTYFETKIYPLLVTSPKVQEVKRRYFLSNENSFHEHFLLPIMINAYNAGPSRVQDAVGWFIDRYPTQAIFEAKFGALTNPYDLFTVCSREIAAEEITEDKLDAYRTDASTYVQRIYALTALMQK